MILSSENGDVNALYSLYKYYNNDLSNHYDSTKAQYWFDRAIESGEKRALEIMNNNNNNA